MRKLYNMRKNKRGLGLRYRFRQENTDRNISDAGASSDKNEGVGEGSLYYDIKSPHEIFQKNPRETSTYKEHPVVSWTDSKEAYQRIARRYRNMLRWNNRIPKIEIRLHLKERTIAEINEPLAKICRTLQRDTKKRKGLRYVAFAEVTTRMGKPICRVHFHFLIDDERSENELKQFFVMACVRAGLVEGEDFLIRSRPLWNGKKYFDYVLKYKKWADKAILFRKVRRAKKGEKSKKRSQVAKRIQKIIHSGWYKKPIKEIRDDIREFVKKHKEAKEKGEDTSGMRFCIDE